MNASQLAVKGASIQVCRRTNTSMRPVIAAIIIILSRRRDIVFLSLQVVSTIIRARRKVYTYVSIKA